MTATETAAGSGGSASLTDKTPIAEISTLASDATDSQAGEIANDIVQYYGDEAKRSRLVIFSGMTAPSLIEGKTFAALLDSVDKSLTEAVSCFPQQAEEVAVEPLSAVIAAVIGIIPQVLAALAPGDIQGVQLRKKETVLVTVVHDKLRSLGFDAEIFGQTLHATAVENQCNRLKDLMVRRARVEALVKGENPPKSCVAKAKAAIALFDAVIGPLLPSHSQAPTIPGQCAKKPALAAEGSESPSAEPPGPKLVSWIAQVVLWEDLKSADLLYLESQEPEGSSNKNPVAWIWRNPYSVFVSVDAHYRLVDGLTNKLKLSKRVPKRLRKGIKKIWSSS